MNKSLLMISLGCVLAFSTPRLLAAGATTVQLTGHVPKILKLMPSLGHLAATNLNLAIGLQVRNEDRLTNLLRQISDPTSTNYHKYLTPGQFTEQFGPTEHDYEALAAFAQQNGLTVTHRHSNRLLLDVSGLSTDIEKAFQINFKTYHNAKEGRDFFATDVEPSVPANLPVMDISGLNNMTTPKPKIRPGRVASPQEVQAILASKKSVRSGSGQQGNYMGNDFRNAYIPGSALNGSGQSVGIFEWDGYFLSDIQQYENMVGRTNIPLVNVLIDGYNGQPIQAGGNGEVSLDIEMVVSMAPALKQIVMYEGALGSAPQNDILNRMATDDSCSQLSLSWGWPGGPQGTTDHIFEEYILQGQSFYNAAGDVDAIPTTEIDDPSLANAPSDSPYQICVGGTTLTMTANGASRVSETVWNWDIEFGPQDDGEGSSGGISAYYKIPYWQTNVNMTACQGSTTFRNFPDVAMTGDNVLVVAGGGQVQLGTGGTSCAAPLWAGFTALVNEQATNNNQPPVGFINPAIYAIANSLNYTNCFHDITTGNDTWSGSPNLFYAVTNYDLASGLGTPNGTNLINALLSTNSIGVIPPFELSAPPQPYGTTMSAMNGGTPNGQWNLFVAGTGAFNTGMISNGWSVTVTLGTPLGSVADLDLTMTNEVAYVQPGSNVVFYLTVTNYGVSTATNVTVTDTLPSGATFISASASTGTVIQSGSDVSWGIANLVSGAGGSLSITMQAPTETGELQNSAIAESTTPIFNTADNSATATVIVGAPSAPQLAAASGAKGQFILTVAGTGTGNTYVEASTNLAHGWTIIYTNVAPFTFTDMNETAFTNRFFRAVTGP